MDTAPGELLSIPHFRGRIVDRDSLYRVEVQVIGLAAVHRWTGAAADSEEAKRKGLIDARQTWRGYALCIRSCALTYATLDFTKRGPAC
jgi:hypothetical protein